MIAGEIKKALSDARIVAPAYQFQAPENKTYPHIVYTYISDRGEMYSEGEEDIQLSEVQIDIYHNSNYNPLLLMVMSVLKEYGFYKGNGWGRFDQDLKIYYYTLRVIKEIENGSN